MLLLSGYALWALHFRAGAATSLDTRALAPDLAIDEGWVWAHFALSDQRSRDFLSAAPDIPSNARDILLGEDCAPRIAFADSWAYGVLPDFGLEFDGATAGLGRTRFALDNKRLITARRHPMQTVHDVHRRVETGGAAFARPLDAFIAINQRYCELAEDQVEDLASDLDHIEDRVLGAEGDLDDVKLGPLRRDLSRRHREVAALRTAYHRASVRHGPDIAHPIIEQLPLLIQHTEDTGHELAALQDRARLVHEELDTRLSGVSNRTLHTLTVMSALLMPPTLVVGAFGMNLKGITFGDDPEGFALVLGVCAATVAAVYIVLRRLRVLK
ncbi:MAG: hypothetical protein GC155_15095 [Alphaproteobacteria bacterium]|nr:hypothetical protein [Alphaproteobacteria bacterium]